MRLALLALFVALAVNYYEPLPGLFSRLWVWAQEVPLPAAQQILQGSAPSLKHTSPAAADSQAPRKGYRHHIVAVGDLHGDLPNALTVLEMAKVITRDAEDPEHFAWSGDIDTLVQTGDVVDRGTDTIKLYKMLEQLRAEAQAVGGQVVSTHGNHEWMNAIGDWRYVTQPDIRTFGSVAKRQEVISTGFIGRAWRNNYTVAARVPLHPSLGPVNTDYAPPSKAQAKTGDDSAATVKESPLSHAALAVCHGGLAPTYPDLSPFPSRINAIGSSLLAKLQDRPKQPPPHPPNPYPGLPGATPSEERMYGEDGPLWYRGWAQDSEARVCARVDKVLQLLGARRLIMGHTPDFTKVVSRCGGKVIIIDTGISHAYGGVLAALEIIYTLDPSEEASDVWEEREIVNAIYKAGPQLLADNSRTVKGDFSAWANVQ